METGDNKGHEKIETLGQLRETGYKPKSIRAEMRDNLKRKLESGERLFPGIQGYDRTVIPAVTNAILAGHDFILLGLRGQAKTRILRMLTSLLDERIPVLEGSELNDDPLTPLSTWGQRRVHEAGDETPIGWLTPEERYNEKLATPDVSVADLLGDIDPIKAATRKLTYADPEVIHFGIIPRTHRGIFAINELPDLAPRIQVGLLNLLEERDLQIRGFPIRIPLDILMVFSANPEDYTNRGTIITPLKDRIASQILTHYPREIETAMRITEAEAWTDRGDAVVVPDLARRLIEQISEVARDSDLVDQTSGVSARLAISALELLVSNLERRALTTEDEPVYARLADFHNLLPALTGKIEMVYEGEQKGVEVVARQLIGGAVKALHEELFPPITRELGSGGEDDIGPYAQIVEWFANGGELTLSDEAPFSDHHASLETVPGLMDLAGVHPTKEEQAFAAELLLDALHQHVKLGRDDLDSKISYKEMVKFQLLGRRQQASISDDEFN